MIRPKTRYLEALQKNAAKIKWMLGVMLLINSNNAFSQGSPEKSGKVFKAGAAVSNITPKVGTSINGNMQDVDVRNVHDDTFAKSIV